MAEYGNAVVMKSNKEEPYEEVPTQVKAELRKNAYQYSQAYGFDIEAVEYIIGPMYESMRSSAMLDPDGDVVDYQLEPVEGQWDHLFAWNIVVADKKD